MSDEKFIFSQEKENELSDVSEDEFEPVDIEEKEIKEEVQQKKQLLPSYYSRNRDAILKKSRDQRQAINQMKAEGGDIQNYSQSYYTKNREAILKRSRENYIERKKNTQVYNTYLNERKGYYLENREKIKIKNKLKNEIFNSLISKRCEK